MHVINGDTFNDVYFDAVWQAQTLGVPVVTRSHACHELRPAALTIERPEFGLYQGLTRRLNYRFFAVETLQYLAGWGEQAVAAELMLAVNPNMRAFYNENTKLFDGPYGPRLAPGLEMAVKKLQRDPWSRQAAVSIWEPWMDALYEGSKDTPCTLSLQFYRGADRGSNLPRLCCTATMRSNDLNWGTPYDVAAFCAIQCAVAGVLGWKLGAYHHVAGSLHVYDATPPSVPPPDLENWSGRVISLPDLTLYSGDYAGTDSLTWLLIQRRAEILLMQLCDHRLKHNRPWTEFESSLESHDHFLAPYWRQWCHLIRTGIMKDA